MKDEINLYVLNTSLETLYSAAAACVEGTMSSGRESIGGVSYSLPNGV